MVGQKAKLSTSLDELQDELSARTQELSAVVQHLTDTEKELKSVSARLVQAEKDRYIMLIRCPEFSFILILLTALIDTD